MSDEEVWAQAKRRLGLSDLTEAEKAALLTPHEMALEVIAMLDAE